MELEVKDLIHHNNNFDEKFINRFLSKVEKKEACWEWTGAIQSKGYGVIEFENRLYLSHRISYVLFIGPIPEGLLCLHRCDNRRCINPDHLFLGTYQDNVNDMVNKNRQAFGEKNGRAKLTWEKVIEIRKMAYLENISLCKIARIYDVSPSTISKVALNEYWKLPLAT